MKYTDNYNLKMPEQTDYINVDDFNYNFIKIDKQIREEIDKIPPINDATETEQGLVKVESTELEQTPHTVLSKGVAEERRIALENYISEVSDGLERLENAILTDVTGNPFEISFKDLEGLEVTGYWNKELQRLEV